MRSSVMFRFSSPTRMSSAVIAVLPVISWAVRIASAIRMEL
jgi:hypothetical protein